MSARVGGRRAGVVVTAAASLLLVGATAYAAGLRFTAAGIGTASDNSVTIPRLTTSLAGSAQPASAKVGDPVRDRAVLSGSTTGAGGTVTYVLYGPNDATCTTTAGTGASATAAGPGTYDSGALSTTGLQPGTYRWVASYQGDLRNAPSATGCADAAQVLTLVANGFSATALKFTNGGTTAGRAEVRDTIQVDFSAAVTAASICSTWDGTAATAPAVTITFNDHSRTTSSHDEAAFTSTACTLNLGALDLGGGNFVSSSTKVAVFSGTLALSNAGKSLVLTLGSMTSGGVTTDSSSVSSTYAPSASIKSGSTSITATPVSVTGIAF